MTTPFDAYLAQIQADLQGGKATEHTYRSSIETLLESLAPQQQSVQHWRRCNRQTSSRRRNSIPYNTPCNHR